MNRRDFFGLMAKSATAAAAMSVLDPERLLWIPGTKTFFLPEAKPVALAPLITEAKAYGVATTELFIAGHGPSFLEPPGDRNRERGDYRGYHLTVNEGALRNDLTNGGLAYQGGVTVDVLTGNGVMRLTGDDLKRSAVALQHRILDRDARG